MNTTAHLPRTVEIRPTPPDASRRLPAIEPIVHPLVSQRLQSPLRYPGAKSRLASTIRRLVESASAHHQIDGIDLLVEPFAGGGSISLNLVSAGVVSRVLLADADPMVAAFWQVAAADSKWLIDRATDEHQRFVAVGGNTAIERWRFWRRWHDDGRRTRRTRTRELAVRCLFLNRTTFSGILHGQAGPIGGYEQKSQYTIDCRWPLDGINQRIEFISHLYDTGRLVDVWCRDWSETLDEVPERYPQLIPSKVVAYLDPPYISKSGKLYSRSFTASRQREVDPSDDLEWNRPLQHENLAAYLRTKAQFRWLLSYDHHPSLVTSRGLYRAGRMSPSPEDRKHLGVRSWPISKRVVSLHYSASTSTRGDKDELLLTTFPPSTVPSDTEFRPVIGW